MALANGAGPSYGLPGRAASVPTRPSCPRTPVHYLSGRYTVQERALRLYLVQPLARIAGEGDDPRISFRREAGEGVPAPGARFARSTRPSPERRTFAR